MALSADNRLISFDPQKALERFRQSQKVEVVANCIGSLLYWCDITQKEQYFDPSLYSIGVLAIFRTVELSSSILRTNLSEDAVALAITSSLSPYRIFHIGLINPEEKTMLLHRPDVNKKVKQEPILDVVAFHQSQRSSILLHYLGCFRE